MSQLAEGSYPLPPTPPPPQPLPPLFYEDPFILSTALFQNFSKFCVSILHGINNLLISKFSFTELHNAGFSKYREGVVGYSPQWGNFLLSGGNLRRSFFNHSSFSVYWILPSSLGMSKFWLVGELPLSPQ